MSGASGDLHILIGHDLFLQHFFYDLVVLTCDHKVVHMHANRALVISTPAIQYAMDIWVHNEAVTLQGAGVAKLLYLAKRVRPKILTAISFLASRVLRATLEDKKKFDRILVYLTSGPDLGLTLECDEDIQVHAYVDASFGVHSDGKSHTGGVVSLGGVPTYVKSTKQRLVSKSSTDLYEVEYDHDVDSFVVVINPELSLRFSRRDNIYPCDFSQMLAARCFVTTVENNESMYSKREVLQAQRAKELSAQLGYPSTRDLIDMINAGSITNIPVTVRDVQRVPTPFMDRILPL